MDSTTNRLVAVTEAARAALSGEDIRAVVVTEDGFAIVTDEGSFDFARKMLDRAENTLEQEKQ